MHAIAAPGGHDAVLERARVEAEHLFTAQAELLAPGRAARERDRRTPGDPRAAASPRPADRRAASRRGRGRSRAPTSRGRPSSPTSPRARARTRGSSRTRRCARRSARGSRSRSSAPSRTSGGGSRSSSTTGRCSRCRGSRSCSTRRSPRSTSRPTRRCRCMEKALERHRETIRALRDLSFNLEPVVLRDQGFGPAVKALAEQLGLAHQLQIDARRRGGGALGEKAQAALYQIIREAMTSAIRRGPPTRIAVTVTSGPTAARSSRSPTTRRASGAARRSTALAERARTLNGALRVDQEGRRHRHDRARRRFRRTRPSRVARRGRLPHLRLDADRLRAPRAEGEPPNVGDRDRARREERLDHEASARRRSRATSRACVFSTG